MLDQLKFRELRSIWAEMKCYFAYFTTVRPSVTIWWFGASKSVLTPRQILPMTALRPCFSLVLSLLGSCDCSLRGFVSYFVGVSCLIVVFDESCMALVSPRLVQLAVVIATPDTATNFVILIIWLARKPSLKRWQLIRNYAVALLFSTSVNICFRYLLESPHRVDSFKYPKHMAHKEI